MKNLLFVFAAIVLVISCKKHTVTPPSLPFILSSMPMDDSNMQNMIPLGNLNPPSHTLPTGHAYFFPYDNMKICNVYCPGKLYLINVTQKINGVGAADEFTEYQLYFGSWNDKVLKLDHIQTLTADILAQVGAFPTSGCNEYSVSGRMYRLCQKDLAVPYLINAGQLIGTIGGQPTVHGFDFGVMQDYKEIQFQPFLTDSLLNKLRPKIGYLPRIRTAEPVCGVINLDISGTAKGNWYLPGQERNREEYHIALAQDNIDPTIPKLSIGTSLTNQNSGIFDFDKQNTGVINRGFESVTNNGNIYCYNLKQNNIATGTSIILKLTNDTTIQIEKRSCDCSCNTPYVFSANAVTYTR